jgi:hypothetical protein
MRLSVMPSLTAVGCALCEPTHPPVKKCEYQMVQTSFVAGILARTSLQSKRSPRRKRLPLSFTPCCVVSPSPSAKLKQRQTLDVWQTVWGSHFWAGRSRSKRAHWSRSGDGRSHRSSARKVHLNQLLSGTRYGPTVERWPALLKRS